MANKDDYLTTYREFFENFAKSVNPNDQLPVKLASYKLLNIEVVGGIIDWTTQYLTQQKCPQHLFAPLIKNIIEEMRKACKKDPLSFGFNSSDNAYEPLKLMQAVMAKTNEICLRYLDNSMLCSLPSPSNTFCETSVHAIRNKRQKMEDRHVAIHDLNTMFNIQEASPSSYYAIFDGHAGHDAAVYSSAHLHQFLAENKYFIGNPEQALLDAFCKTDALFLEKCKVENLSGGTTAVVALLRPKEKTLYIAWVGDSQALLVKEGKILQCVNPHKPCREDERERIEKAGGCVMLWGTWRVNGQLAVSRAIGDVDYKPHVIAVPDVKEVSLDGNEDFLIIACDGLWDYLSEYAAADEVYFLIKENPDDTERISKQLVQRARYEGSTDNISVIVVFLKDPHKIAAEAHRWATKDGPPLNTDNMEAGLDNVNNPFTNSNGTMKNLDVETDNIHLQKSGDGLLLNLTDNFKTNGTNLSQDIFEKSNGTKKSSSDIHFDGDFGPETDVDAVDDAFSPVEKTKSFADSLITGFDEEHLTKSSNNEDVVAFNVGLANNNPLDGNFNPFSNKQAVDEDKEDKKEEQQVEEHGGDNREETPTPPVDAVHDVGGLEENPAESDSEDEWNYIQGDQAKPETLLLQSETVVESSELEDEMSQLNPNAAEFVPVSPTRSIPSPACRALINEQVISQSPKRPLQVDIKVPNEMEFETEVKSRPSDFDALSNGHDSDSEHNVSSGAEQIENILNGKSIDEIPEFRPGSTPSKQLLSEEFHFGPNAAPFTPKLLDQSEAFSTKANFGDDTEQTLNDSELAIPHKDLTDPMSMSFSAERGESNPFQDEDDLNRVHDLPENLDEFLEKTSVGDNKENRILDDTISDLPEHDVLGKVVDNDQAAIQTTDLDKISQDDEKELASPLEPDQDDFLVDDKEIVQSKTPDLLDDFVVVPEKNVTDDSNIASLPELEPISPVKQDGENLQSTLHQELDDDSRLSPSQGHPEFLQEQDRSVSPTVDPLSELSETKSPLPEDTEIIQASSDAPETDLLESKSPLPDPELSHQEKPPLEEDIDFLHSKSPVQSDADILETKSPLPGDAEIPVEQENVQELNLGENLQIPENEGQGGLGSQSPACEFMSGAKSPLCDFEHSKSPVYEQESTNDILVSEPVLKNEVENIDSSLVVKKLSSSPACEYSADPAICDRFQTDARSPFDSQNEQKHEEESTSSVKDDISSPIEAMSPEHVLEETVSEEIHKTTSEPVEETPLVDEQEVSKIEVHGEISSQELLGDLSCTVTSTQSHELLDDKKEYDTHEALEPLDLPKKTELFNGLNNVDSEFNEQISIKTDNIKLEFAEPAVLSPSEDSKIIDEVPVVTTSEAPVQEQKTEETSPIHEQVQEVAKEFPIISTESSVVETVGISQEPSKELPVLEPLPIVPLVSQDTIEVKKEEKKSSTPASAKKITGKPSLSKSSTTSPKTALKASPSPAASHKTGVAPRVLSKTGTTKPSTALKSPASATTASKPSPKPKTTAAPKPIDKKPLTNGEVKPTSKTSLTKKPEVAATKTTTRPTTATTKTSPTKPIAPRPTATSKTVPPKGTATLKPTSSTTSAPKPRVPLSSRTTSNSTANKLTTAPNSKSTTQPTSRPATATGSAKPKTITSAPSKPRVPLTKTITKSADVEKEKKESANKLTASHTSTVNKSTSNRTSTTAIKKTETKPISQRTAISKTSTTTTRTNTITKKPTEVKSVTKTKTTKIEKPKENGVAPTSITEEIKEMTTVNNVVNNTETLVKDNSPLDNKLISETTNNLIDVNPAD